MLHLDQAESDKELLTRSKERYGKAFAYHECQRCLAVWSDTEPRNPSCESGHPLLCCGAMPSEVTHCQGCEKDPMFQAGLNLAKRREEAFWKAFLGDDFKEHPGPKTMARIHANEDILAGIASLLRCKPEQIIQRVNGLQAELKKLKEKCKREST